MAHKNIQRTYMTLKQFADKHEFATYASLRWQIYHNDEFEKQCVRRFGNRILIDEQKTLDFIDKCRVKSK